MRIEISGARNVYYWTKSDITVFPVNLKVSKSAICAIIGNSPFRRPCQPSNITKLDYVSIEYVIPRCGINPSAHAVLNAPIYASSHDVHVRLFTIGTFTTCSKKRKKNINNCHLGFDLADFRQKVPWERSRVAFSKVIFG